MPQRLEQALRLWEDLHFLLEQNKRIPGAPSIHSSVRPWDTLRKALLGIRPFQDLEELNDTVAMPAERHQIVGTGLSRFPLSIASWCANSRRVYRLTREAASLMQATDIGELTWQDFNLPFKTFAIQLDTPVHLSALNVDIDFLVLSTNLPGIEGGLPTWSIFGISSKLETMNFLTDKRRERILKTLRKQRWNDAATLLREQFKEAARGEVVYMQAEMRPEPIKRTVAEALEKAGMITTASFNHDKVQYGAVRTDRVSSSFHALTHLCLSFAIYLDVLSRAKHLQVTTHVVHSKQDANMSSRGKSVITEETQLCLIESNIYIPKEGMEAIEKAGERATWGCPRISVRGTCEDRLVRETIPMLRK